MFKLLGWTHALLLRFVLWLLTLPLKAIWAAVALVLAWLGEEFRRWAGLAASGAMLALAGKATLNYAPAELKRPLVMAVLVMLAVWSLAVMRAARYTRFLIRANLQPVRTRRTFRELFGKQAEIGEQVKATRAEVTKGMARRARGTPLEGAWRSNREDRARRAAEAEAAAEQAEQERATAAEWDQAVAAKRAERERFAAEAARRWTNRQQEGA